jgi:CIC family chloride channel protein
VIHLFARGGIDEIAVVDRFDPRQLVGSVREKDVIEARNHEMLRRDLSGGISTSVTAVGRGGRVDLGGGFALEEVVAPPSVFDRTLRDINLRALTGVHVLLIRRRGLGAHGSDVRVPNADDVIREGDALVVAGSFEALERLQSLQHLLEDAEGA